ncbi:MAG: arginine repressor [Clostridia bacterium]
MSRSTRQSKILDIIKMKDVETQEDLVDTLISSGIDVTQATISRDIKELGLIKTMSDNGTYRYVTVKSIDHKIPTKLINMFKEAVLSIVPANNLLVIKTLPGSAGAVANVVDQMNSTEMIGSIAGADTLLIVSPTENDAYIMMDKLTRIIKS